MGTNFYVKRKPSEKDKQHILSLLSEDKYQEIQDFLTNDLNKEYHIGKRSGGWQFLFSPKYARNHSTGEKIPWMEPYPWEENLQSIKDYIGREDMDIYDEYGEHFTPQQFWEEEVGQALYNDPEKYINGPQYDKKHPEHKHWSVKYPEYTNDEGIRFASTYEFS